MLSQTQQRPRAGNPRMSVLPTPAAAAPDSASGAQTPPRAAALPRPPLDRFQKFLRSPKGSLTLVFLPLLAIGGASVGWPLVIPHILAALLGACLVDIIIGVAQRGRLAWPSSALLSGLIVAFVLGPLEPRLLTFAVAALASLSKHVLKTRQGHIFNPAALALVISVPLFGTGQSWWGALANVSPLWLILLLLGGAIILERLNKFPLALTFLAVYFGLFAFAGLVGPARVAEMFRMPFTNAALFLACFMLTDPPTSPGRLNDQLWFGGLVAIVAAVAQVAGVGQTYLLVGLLTGNLTLALRRLLTQRSVLATTQRSATRSNAVAVPSRPR